MNNRQRQPVCQFIGFPITGKELPALRSYKENIASKHKGILGESTKKTDIQLEIEEKIERDSEYERKILDFTVNPIENHLNDLNSSLSSLQSKVIAKESNYTKKSIIVHLLEQLSLLLEWEKTFKSDFENSEFSPIIKCLKNNLLDITPDFWKTIKENSKFIFINNKYYTINQYTKYYFWMRTLLEIEDRNFKQDDAKKFQEAIPTEIKINILKQKDFVNSLMRGITAKSFNQFIINVDLVFANLTGSKLQKFNKIKALEKKAYLNKKIHRNEIIFNSRKNISKNDFLNRIYLDVMNELLMKLIYPINQLIVSTGNEVDLTIERQISKNIVNTITE